LAARPAVHGFSKGPDGGKDARFHGHTERFPMLERIFKLLIDRDYDLKMNKRLTRTVLYYMYLELRSG